MKTLTIAATEAALGRICTDIQNRFYKSWAGEYQLFGDSRLYVAWDIGLHLSNGQLTLRPNNEVHIQGLEVLFDPVRLSVFVDLPDVTVGGQCVVKFAGKCRVRLPKFTLFSGKRDIVATIDISGLQSRLSATGQLSTGMVYRRPAGMDAWTAHDQGTADLRQVTIQLVRSGFNFDPIDYGGIAGNILDKAIDDAASAVLGGLPGWAKKAVKALLGDIADLVRSLLRLPSDIRAWIEERLEIDLDWFNWICRELITLFAEKEPIGELEEPFPLLETVQHPYRNAVLVGTDRLELSTDIEPGELVLMSTLK